MNLAEMRGRKTIYSDDLAEKALQYLENFEDHQGDVLPTVERMSLKIGVSLTTMYRWSEDKEHPFHTILSLIKCTQSADLQNKGLAKKFDASISRLLLGKHGFTEKTQTEISGPDGNSIMLADFTGVDEEELDRRLSQIEDDLENVGHD